MPDRIGQQVGHYRLLRRLGKGGFAEVYLGEHIYLHRQAAIKLVLAPLATKEEVKRFQQEAQLIAALRHPHIVNVLEFGVEDETPYLIMDYAPGGSLRQRYPSGTLVPPLLIASYVSQVAQALQYAHDHHIIHRDIKPQNLLLGVQDELLLSDFGISIVAESSSRQQAHTFEGTVAYAAPEQLQGKPRPASDQYALGVVVYEWLCGKLPFTGDLREVIGKHLTTPPPSLCEQIPMLPPTVEEAIFTALAKDPKARFANISAFARALQQAIHEMPSIVLKTTQQLPSTPQGRSRPKSTGSGAITPKPGNAMAEEAMTPHLTPPLLPQLTNVLTLSSQSPASTSGASDSSSSADTAIAPGQKPSVTQTTPEPPQPSSQPARQWRRDLFVYGISLLLLAAIIVVAVAGIGPLLRAAPAEVQAQGTATKQATATARPQPTPTVTIIPTGNPAPLAASYIAPVPGPNCDKGGGQWTTAASTVSCTANGMELRQTSTDILGVIEFKWPGHPFPQDYRVIVDITLLPDTGSLFTPAYCAAVLVRAKSTHGYAFFICDNGSWQIYRYDNANTTQLLSSGSVQGSESYHVQVITQGSAQELSIDQKPTATATDSTYQDTAAIGLGVFTEAGFGEVAEPGAAAFKNFVYTPMPTS